jgi:outer membrane immunogenic protein
MRLRISLAAAGLAIVSVPAAPALAADIGTAEPLPTPEVVAPEPATDWTGFHLGALLGWTWADADTNAPEGDAEADGVDGGVYAGFDYQMGNFVIGAEGDLIVSGVDGDEGPLSLDQGLNGSLRARAGIALDQFLLYGTGGAALTDVELDGGGSGDDATLWGWTVGAGAEAMITDNITARVEYRYTDYEDETFSVGAPPGSVESDLSTHSVRAGVGVKF